MSSSSSTTKRNQTPDIDDLIGHSTFRSKQEELIEELDNKQAAGTLNVVYEHMRNCAISSKTAAHWNQQAISSKFPRTSAPLTDASYSVHQLPQIKVEINPTVTCNLPVSL